MRPLQASRIVVAGAADAPVVVLDEPLSFWGGFSSETGDVIDVHHPQHGASLAQMVVVVAGGRGSSSASSVIAEAARVGTSPAALIVLASDEILSTGAIVADELYGRPLPIMEVDSATFAACRAAEQIQITADGQITLDGESVSGG